MLLIIHFPLQHGLHIFICRRNANQAVAQAITNIERHLQLAA